MPILALILIVPTVLGFNHLASRYKYTPRSKRLLAALGILSFIFPFIFIRYHFPLLELSLVVAAALALGLPTFAFLGVAATAAWRKRKQAAFDRAISELARRRTSLQERLYTLDQRLEMILYRQAEAESRDPDTLARQRGLRAKLEAWQQAGGMARIRTIKVTEWQEEATRQSAEELAARQVALKEEADRESDPDRISHLEAQLAVVGLELAERGQRTPESELRDLAKNGDELRTEKKAAELELIRVKEEMAEWERRRAHFLSQQILLD